MIDRTRMIESSKRAKDQGVECWLSWQNRTDELRLPVTPFFDLSKPKNNQTLNLYGFGDINVPGNRGLKSMEISSFFPHAGHNYSFCPQNTDDPYNYCRLIDKRLTDKYPIRIIFTNTTINIAMMIENFSYGESDRTRDVYYKLSLREYRFVERPTALASMATTFQNAVAKSYSAEATGDDSWNYDKWTVKYGDTLTGISVAKFGDPSYVQDIIRWNAGLITNPDSLKNITGQDLILKGERNVG